MKNKKGILIVLGFITLSIVLYSLTYIPHKIFKINTSDVSKIVVFYRGEDIDIVNDREIENIITNLNNLTFNKGEPSFAMGYYCQISIVNTKGKVVKKFIIKSDSSISYNGFIYRTQNETIDLENIEKFLPLEHVN